MTPTIHEIVTAYLDEFPDENPRIAQLRSLMDECDTDEALIARDNYVGHVTASAFIISPCRTQVLMLRHKKLELWLQPGGHVESEDNNPFLAALRKIQEETGFTRADYLAYHYDDVIPTDIDTHQIAATGDAPIHFHHDFRYAFLSNRESEIRLNEEKFHEFKWQDLSELLRWDTYKLLKPKLERLLSGEYRPKIFFDRLFKSIERPATYASLVVTHLLPDVRVYLRTLDKVSSHMAVIPKPKSIDRAVFENTKPFFTFCERTRDQLREDRTVADFISTADAQVILFDIGGYFAPIANSLKAEFPDKLLGIVEDTENGHQKYEAVGALDVPVLSVARSPLKENEDFLVGQSVLFSTDAVLREVGKLIQYLYCSVFGFGKIGSSIAHHLLSRGIKPAVYDTNPIRRMCAANRLCATPARHQIVRTSDVIFCATGSQVLNIHDFRALKPGCAVVSVTSSDDEMDLRHLEQEYQFDDVSEHVTRCSSASNHFFLVNRGNAVNFIHKAALGDFIHIVRGEMVFAADQIAKGAFAPGLHELDKAQRANIAELWLATFIDEPTTLRDYSQVGI